jgi:hypothetical protein
VIVVHLALIPSSSIDALQSTCAPPRPDRRAKPSLPQFGAS